MAKRLAVARVEAPGRLLVRHPLGQQREDLDLAGGEARRPLAPPRHAMAGGAEDGLDGLGVAAAGPHVGPQRSGRLVAERGGRWGRGSRIAW
jgi:hypothetical protein